MKFPYFAAIGWRYTRAGRRNHFVSFNSLVSIVGVMVGVAALIVVLSVMNGFEQELRSRILGVVSHITVKDWSGRLPGWQAIATQLEKRAEVIAAAPFVELEGLLATGENSSGVLVRGIDTDAEERASNLGEYAGRSVLERLQPGAYRIVLGNELARSLGVLTGDRVTLVTPQAMATPAGLIPRLRRFEVAGVFTAGMHEYDSALALIHLADAQKLVRIGADVHGIRLRVADLLMAPRIAAAVAQDYPGLAVSDWTRQNVNFFRAVRTEKIIMFLILMMIVVVAAFNVIATLVMVVNEKRGDIAILRTMGASPAGVMMIFVLQGSIIGLVGTLLGAVTGVLLAANVETLVPTIEKLLGIDFWPADVYYISEIPSELRWTEVGLIVLTSALLCVLATVYPARRAARVEPAQALRYE